MVFYVLSRRIFDYNFKNNEATGFIVSELFFDMSINIAAKFLFYQLKLLKILSLTAVPRTRFHGNFVRKLHFNDVGFWFVIVRYFVLLNNYITLGLQKHEFLIKSNIRHFFGHSDYVWKLRHNYVASWFVNLLYLFLCQNYVINAFLTTTYFSWR